jgi:lipocalin
VKETFERKGYCVTADYALFPNGSVSVRNAQRVGGPGGKPDALTGYADRPDPKVEGKLVVHLSGVPHGGSYWVVLLGPDTYGPNRLYQYSVVTDSHSTMLFVLARNVTEFKTNYDTMMLKNLTDLGFTHFWNKPIATYQGADCQYV